MLKVLKTLHGEISLPTFFPDATRAVVKGGLDSVDLKNAGIEGIVVNTLHLGEILLRDDDAVRKDVHEFMRWDQPMITDSGGFQIMSLIHNNPKLGYLTDTEAVFINDRQEKIIFTPEKSIQLQLRLGADILICLDDCTRPDASHEDQEKSVERTIAWARRCKDEFDRLTQDLERKPLLFAVVQGGTSKELRKHCADRLLAIDFDGYCFGGFPVDEERNFLTEIVEYTCSLLPEDKPRYAMGVGRPQDIISCFAMGYTMFDCVIPTREARHKRLYIFRTLGETQKIGESEDQNFGNSDSLNIRPSDPLSFPSVLTVPNTPDFFETLSLAHSKHQNDPAPISNVCDCLTCQNYSRSYLYHLFKIKDLLAYRLATIHNLRFYTRLLESLKNSFEVV